MIFIRMEQNGKSKKNSGTKAGKRLSSSGEEEERIMRCFILAEKHGEPREQRPRQHVAKSQRLPHLGWGQAAEALPATPIRVNGLDGHER